MRCVGLRLQSVTEISLKAMFSPRSFAIVSGGTAGNLLDSERLLRPFARRAGPLEGQPKRIKRLDRGEMGVVPMTFL
jgi:hypothetical protein